MGHRSEAEFNRDRARAETLMERGISPSLPVGGEAFGQAILRSPSGALTGADNAEGTGMSEMIERVARAMCLPFSEDDVVWLGVYMKRWESHKDSARLAIEAMREPTEHMCISVAAQADHVPSGAHREVLAHGYRRIFTAMIDAALEAKA